MFLFLICMFHLLSMFNGYMIISIFILSLQTLQMLLFMYMFFKHGCNLSSMLVIYGINLSNIISGRSMSLISINSQQPLHKVLAGALGGTASACRCAGRQGAGVLFCMIKIYWCLYGRHFSSVCKQLFSMLFVLSCLHCYISNMVLQ